MKWTYDILDGFILDGKRVTIREVLAALNQPEMEALAETLAEYDRLHEIFMTSDTEEIEEAVRFTAALPPARDAVIEAARAVVNPSVTAAPTPPPETP